MSTQGEGFCPTCGRALQPGEGSGSRVWPQPRRRAPGEIEARIARVAPLFAYVEREGIRLIPLISRVCMRLGVAVPSRARIYQIKAGRCVTPDWFVREVCAELRRPIAEVMGAEWVAREERSQKDGGRSVAG